MTKSEDQTVNFILQHKMRVKKWATKFSNILLTRAETHDDSKLREPEFTGWHMMDKEPRYKYGTPQYKDKLNRYHWLMELHWTQNRHHPEYWDLHPDDKDRDLIDILEMMIDWLSYKDIISMKEAIELVDTQTQRYNISEELSDLIKNTVLNYFSTLGGAPVANDLMNAEKTDRIDLGKMFSSYV